MCDDPSHAILAADNSRLQEENDRLESLIHRPVYVTVTPPTAPYKPPDPSLANINVVLNSISMHLSSIDRKIGEANNMTVDVLRANLP